MKQLWTAGQGKAATSGDRSGSCSKMGHDFDIDHMVWLQLLGKENPEQLQEFIVFS